MNTKIIESMKPIGYTLGAIVIMIISSSLPKSDFFNYIIMTLMYLHTAPILLDNAKSVSKDKFQLVCYIYSLVVFLLTKSVVCLLMLNIFQSINGLYKFQESEANVNRTNV